MRSMGRDESIVEYGLKMLLHVLMNFTMGLIATFFIFIFGLWSIVRSYQPEPLSAMIFFVCAVSAAFAFVATYLFAIYGAAAGSVYGLAKIAETNARIGNNQRRQQVRHRPHYQ